MSSISDFPQAIVTPYLDIMRLRPGDWYAGGCRCSIRPLAAESWGLLEPAELLS